MTTAIPELQGKFTVGAANDTITVGAGSANVAAGTYYTSPYTGEATTQFTAALQAAIRTITGHGNANVVYYGSNCDFVIALNVAAAVTFDDASLATACGFNSASLASAATHHSNRVPRYVWRPDRPPSGHPVDANVLWAPRSSTHYGRSIDGTTWSVAGSLTYDATLAFQYLDDNVVMTPAGGTVYADFQQFFEDVVHLGQPIRVIMNRAQYAATTDYKEATWHMEDEELGSFTDYAARNIETYNGLWSVTLPLMKKV